MSAPALLSRPWEDFESYTAWRRTKTVDLATREMHLLHGASGSADEIGEFFEVANFLLTKVSRKSEWNSIPGGDYVKLRKEAGDILFYLNLTSDTLLNSWASDAMLRYGREIPNVVDAFDARIQGPDTALVKFKIDELVVMGSRILGPVKKCAFYGVQLDQEAVAKNVVYSMFAVAYVMKWAAMHAVAGDQVVSGSVSEILRANVEKLDVRYAQGFVLGGGDRTGKGE